MILDWYALSLFQAYGICGWWICDLGSRLAFTVVVTVIGVGSTLNLCWSVRIIAAAVIVGFPIPSNTSHPCVHAESWVCSIIWPSISHVSITVVVEYASVVGVFCSTIVGIGNIWAILQFSTNWICGEITDGNEKHRVRRIGAVSGICMANIKGGSPLI